MKKNYLNPEAEYVRMVVGPMMQIIEGSTFEGVGTGSGTSGDEDPEAAGKYRGEWGNLWKK